MGTSPRARGCSRAPPQGRFGVVLLPAPADLAARACTALGLPGNDPQRAAAARNKALMAAALDDGHVITPRTTIVADLRELWDLYPAGAVGFPCVVKPADGSRSRHRGHRP
ncbi:hypothetical protein FNV65_06295 [Streptomyces sp. S1A1-8]|uniref:hypothetical protein n=1 Tax=unclassified Streptomyces TaxID=2593676 RepID=UPI001165973D|nr:MULTISPECIES: hypothetical protein [unclassified Streptomyces]QDN95969.1 hypothetical protein FNV58_07725 [Streptomyces sp. RLB1-9]QDO17690.1 hypothetical protein FNV65_06295 [Streptomyces sp. S1A1-8]QDO27816.1 hypothetical protein FNV63_06285 [Streptomyces sp. S1A1-3]